MNATDATLDSVLIRQLTWKPSIATAVACRIVQTALTDDHLWPDEVDFSQIPSLTEADKNCIGLAWRNLVRQGILERGTSFRRSTAPNANGRTVFAYRLVSFGMAKTFLERNGATWDCGQQELL
jgi:hypothetical protein